MPDDLLLRADRGAVATLTLNDPARLNVLGAAMLDALADALAALAHDPAIRVIILRAAGRAFCAGHDLREMTQARQSPDAGAAYFTALFEKLAQIMVAMTQLPQPVVAEVQGIATAAGCQLVAGCDLAVAAETARFGVNGVNIGLFCSTPMVALTRNVPPKHAFHMLTTGEMIPADEARTLGLVNQVVPAQDLPAATRALADRIAAKLGPVVAIGKRAFYDQAALPLAEAYALAGAVMNRNLQRADTAEGLAAFLEKRPPQWDQ